MNTFIQSYNLGFPVTDQSINKTIEEVNEYAVRINRYIRSIAITGTTLLVVFSTN